LIFHLHRVDSVDTSEDGILGLTNTLEVCLLDSLESQEVTLSHGLDDKVLVLGKEEETSRLALGLSSLENR